MTPATLSYSQQERLLSINTILPDDTLLLEQFSGAETLSTPYEFKVVLLSTDRALDIKSLLRTPATASVVLANGVKRHFHGLFRSLKQVKEGGNNPTIAPASGISNPRRDLMVYEGILAPQLWFLSLDSNCRIIQAMTVPAIVEKVLHEAGIRNLDFRLSRTYEARDYSVQYRESSLRFISRLLEQEGIFYFFEHTKTEHTIVFADNSSIRGRCPDQPTARYAYSALGWVDGAQDGIIDFERIEQAHTGKVALTDYFFEKPFLNLGVSLTGEASEEVFDYPGNYIDLGSGERVARLRLEEREAEQSVASGVSRCRAFRPGYIFKMEGHFRPDNNQEYFLTSVSHEAVELTYRGIGEEEHRYSNTFSGIPKTVLYRPPQKTLRPVMPGPQSALVVGKAGEEIWVDRYGRVKVQFYWDRLGKRDETSSCWVRVSQVWAGKNWGWMTIPRIGQEVIVDFLEGDPERPIITGRVYNADQMPPYSLPAGQTQSGVRTRSSREGRTSNYNEIRFEDLNGSEKIIIRAERDLETSIEHNYSLVVGNSHNVFVSQGDYLLKVQLGKIENEAAVAIELRVGENAIIISQAGITVKGKVVTIQERQ